MKFVDEISFAVASGNGGAGAVTFHREKFVTRGGPDGGDGGRGGALVFRASRARNTLVDFRFNKTYRAEAGQPGAKRNMTGRSGDDLVLEVPVGTLVYVDDSDEQLADLDEAGKEWRLPGGRGGKGNTHFATATHRTPRFAQDGEPGVELRVRLELRLLADVGLLGFPNAGKSTLISRISAAKPKIADYPFTTLVPNLGVVDVGEGRSFVVADVPGLIEGAAQGAGLGHRFLRHLTRCRLLLHLVAADGELDPVDAVHTLRGELRAYSPELGALEEVVVVTKADLLPEVEQEEIVSRFRRVGIEARVISSVSGQGVVPLIRDVWHRLSRIDAPE